MAQVINYLKVDGGQSYRATMRNYFTLYEPPQLLRQRKASRLQCRRFWAVGVNDIWAVDQHDKWIRFGLVLHTGIKPFSGQILWMKIWHSNHNPQLILSYYLEVMAELGCTLGFPVTCIA